jgi:hypothetical protein
MQSLLFAMLILASWVQQKRDDRSPPEPPGDTVVVGIGVLNGGKR